MNELSGKVSGLTTDKQESGLAHTSLSRKVEELTEQVKGLESKLAKTKEKNDEEKNKLITVHTTDAKKKKEKNTLLKAQLTDAEDRVTEIESRLATIKSEGTKLEQ